VEWREFDPDELVVSTQDPLLWPFGAHGTLFGNAPVADPLRFLAEMGDWLRSQGVPETISDYCGGHPLIALAEHFSHPTYAIMSGALPVLDQARRLLQHRGVPTQLLQSPKPIAEGLVVVRFGPSWVVCEQATVELNSRAG
jgi:hypothetical protein